jgi:hypothetical protein
MKGYWEDCPVKTTRPDILATAYIKKGATLVSIASWSDKSVKVKLKIDWKALGLNPQKTLVTAPEIKDFQVNQIFKPADDITVEPGKGWLLVLKESK